MRAPNTINHRFCDIMRIPSASALLNLPSGKIKKEKSIYIPTMKSKKSKGYEYYPLWIVLLNNLVFLSVWATGLLLTYLINPILSAGFFGYMLYLETSVYREGCSRCYYYGKRCAFGRGKIAKLFLKKSNKKFASRKIDWKAFLPSFVPTFAIIFSGFYLLTQQFTWAILGLTIWPIFVFFSNQTLYGELACPNCKQAQLGCPVCEFFMKQAQKK